MEFASKLLSETESSYSNIEREMLVVLYGMEKSHYYAFGRPVVVQSGHKPLEPIFRKHLASVPSPIAREMLFIQKYDAQIKYVPGKDIPATSCHSDAVQKLDVSVHEVYLHPSKVGSHTGRDRQGCNPVSFACSHHERLA